MVSSQVLIFVFNLLSGIVALLVSYYAFRFNRLVENSVLRYVSLGFALLGVGLVAEAGISVFLGVNLVELFVVRRIGVLANAAFLVLQLLAYLVFALGYAVGAFSRPKRINETLSVGSLLVLATPVIRDAVLQFYNFALASELLMVLLLAFVVFEGFLIYSRTHSKFSLMVLAGFALILLGHMIRFGSIAALSPALYVDGTIVQFFGFLSLLVFLIRSGRIGPT